MLEGVGRLKWVGKGWKGLEGWKELEGLSVEIKRYFVFPMNSYILHIINKHFCVIVFLEKFNLI